MLIMAAAARDGIPTTVTNKIAANAVCLRKMPPRLLLLEPYLKPDTRCVLPRAISKEPRSRAGLRNPRPIAPSVSSEVGLLLFGIVYLT
jgi:hypothetical protein